MTPSAQLKERRTSVDEVFDYLHDAISTLQLLPGDKISEAEIAAKFNVSRQPVRDAFNRLELLDFLLIRPQRATEVKRFSSKKIIKSRFIRAAVEADVLRRAAAECDAAGAALLEVCLAEQKLAVEMPSYAKFGELDYAFHKTICQIAKVEFAFEVISGEKASVDRLCMLSLPKDDRMAQLLDDHKQISAHIIAHNQDAAVAAGMVHLGRLDATIAAISEKNPNYFDP